MRLSPGLPTMKSKDLVNWQLIDYTCDNGIYYCLFSRSSIIIRNTLPLRTMGAENDFYRDRQQELFTRQSPQKLKVMRKHIAKWRKTAK
jgi:hypothetical protein